MQKITTEEAKKTSAAELFKQLDSNKNGLSSTEAQQRLQQFGPNEIEEEKVNPLIKFLGYFWGPIPWMIEAAAGLSVAIQHWEDFAIIFTLLVVNAVVGFWEEFKAANAIDALREKLAPAAGGCLGEKANRSDRAR